jgi:hypothetical protein
MSSATQLLGDALVVALIVLMSRWFLSTRNNEVPIAKDGKSIYPVKLRLRLAAGTTALFFTVLPLWMHNDPDAWMLLILTSAGFGCLVLTLGSVILDADGITLKSIGRSQKLPWNQITVASLRPKPNQSVSLEAGSKKLVVDSRFIALDLLINEVAAHTRIPPTLK